LASTTTPSSLLVPVTPSSPHRFCRNTCPYQCIPCTRGLYWQSTQHTGRAGSYTGITALPPPPQKPRPMMLSLLGANIGNFAPANIGVHEWWLRTNCIETSLPHGLQSCTLGAEATTASSAWFSSFGFPIPLSSAPDATPASMHNQRACPLVMPLAAAGRTCNMPSLRYHTITPGSRH